MISRWLLIAASLLHIGMYLFAAPEHAIDQSWPVHARFHIVQAIFWIIGLDLVAVGIGYFTLPTKQYWSRLLLIVIFLTSHLGYFISIIIIPEGRPPESTAHAILAVPLLIYLAGLFFIWRKTE